MNGLMMQIGGLGGFSFTDLLNQLDAWGFFSYVLPFLLIFAVVYAILTKIKIFEDNKGAGIIIALAIGLLALQFDKVPAFFQAVFPNLGIGLSILLVALILSGAFLMGSDKGAKALPWIFFGLGGLIFLIVVIVSLSSYQFAGSWQWTGWWAQYGGLVVFLLIIIGVIVAVVIAGRNKGTGVASH